MEDEMRMRLKCVQLSSSLAAVPFLIFNELTILNTHCMQITVVMNQILNYRYQYQDLKTFLRREMEGNRVCVALSFKKIKATLQCMRRVSHNIVENPNPEYIVFITYQQVNPAE